MLDRLEKKLGKYAIKNLIYYVLGGYVVGYVLLMLSSNNNIYQYITLEPGLVMKGQVWRLFTWICTPPQGLSIWVIFMFLLYFFIGKSLESCIGAFKYNLFMFGGWFFMTLGAMIVYWISNGIFGPSGAISMEISTYYINLASFLAFALLFPNQQVLFFGILPIKVKWLAWFDIAYLGLMVIRDVISLIGLPNQQVQEIIAGYGIDVNYAMSVIVTQIFSIIISLLNFLIFFLVYKKKYHSGGFKQAFRKAKFKRSYNSGVYDNKQQVLKKNNLTPNGEIIHTCTTCGRTNITNPELMFRYCSKCSGNHEYCQDHLFTHVHVE